MNYSSATAILAGSLSLTAAGYFGAKYYLLNRELHTFRIACRDRLKGFPIESRLPSNVHLSALWRLIGSVGDQLRAETKDDSLSQVLSVERRVSCAPQDILETARAVGELLFRQAAPEVCAVAIAHRSSKSAAVKMIYSQGLITKRVGEALETHFERLLGEHEHESWGLRYAAESFADDFSAYGIGASFVVPIRGQQLNSGLIWLGFRSSFLPSSEKLKFIRSLCEYSAGTFASAEHVHKSITERDQQRDFLIGMSHDLRAPGNSALYSLRDLLSEDLGALSREQRLRLEIVEDCLEDQLDILGDILDYTKHQHGLLSANRENLELAAALRRVAENFAPSAAQRAIEFVRGDIPSGNIDIDPRHFKRILSNLLSNALKYTDSGSIELRCEKVGGRFDISVLDTGCGIADHERHLLFKEFSRLNGAVATQGVGLGLVIARTLSELNGGKLEFIPRIGGGSIFCLSLPSAETKRPPVDNKINSILVADDDAATRRTIKRYVEHLSAEVLLAESSDEAISMLDRAIPDLIITDLNLGRSTAAEIFSWLNSRAIKVPAIVVSGTGDRIGPHRLESVAPMLILEKPVDRLSLEQAVAGLSNRASEL